MQWLVLVVIGIGYLISLASDGVKKTQEFNKKKSKYAGRHIDTSQSLFDRNRDIISKFEETLTEGSSYRRYYIENKVRDCINEICLAENQVNMRPNYSYLYRWKLRAPSEWAELANQIQRYFTNKQAIIKKEAADKKATIKKEAANIAKHRQKLEQLKSQRVEPTGIQKIRKKNTTQSININDISDILRPNSSPWYKKEQVIMEFNGKYKKFPLYESSQTASSAVLKLNDDIEKYNAQLKKDIIEHRENKVYFGKIYESYKKKEKNGVIARFSYVLNDLALPKSLPKVWELDFDDEQKIAVVEFKLPDVTHVEVLKDVKLKSGIVQKPLNKREVVENVPEIHPAIMLRKAYEVYRNDIDNAIELLVLNGWVEFDEPSTGVRTKSYTASLVVKKEQIVDIKLNKVKPLVAFETLKGKSAGKLIDIIPITPSITLDREDSRFIDTKEVLNELGSEMNLACMDWQDFESLIAELFDKEFSREGSEVKVTQASRDRGVDAIAFDPDPIKGGKFVIQAKRYTNVVGVSAVRDLCAVVRKEGASRGILVTTSTYGADAYAFANNEPITLMHGAELLGLLKKHGYTFRINLKEAKKMLMENSKEQNESNNTS